MSDEALRLAQEKARREWHRERGLDGSSCPTKEMCESFDTGFARGYLALLAEKERLQGEYLRLTRENEQHLSFFRLEQSESERLRRELNSANAFMVERNVAGDYVRWLRDYEAAIRKIEAEDRG